MGQVVGERKIMNSRTMPYIIVCVSAARLDASTIDGVLQQIDEQQRNKAS